MDNNPSKRHSVAGKASNAAKTTPSATPPPSTAAATGGGSNTNNQQTSAPGMTELDGALSKAIGSRIRITTTLQNHAIEGTLFTADPTTNLVAVNGTPGPAGQPARYHVISVAQIQSFQILSAGSSSDGFEGAVPVVGKIDVDALRQREEAAIRKMKEFDATRNRGVGKEGQEIFDWFARTLPTRWAENAIIVNDSVRVDPPYGLDNCKAARDNKQAETQIRKVLDGYYTRKKGNGSGSGGTSGGGGRPVVPALPRKGG